MVQFVWSEASSRHKCCPRYPQYRNPIRPPSTASEETSPCFRRHGKNAPLKTSAVRAWAEEYCTRLRAASLKSVCLALPCGFRAQSKNLSSQAHAKLPLTISPKSRIKTAIAAASTMSQHLRAMATLPGVEVYAPNSLISRWFSYQLIDTKTFTNTKKKRTRTTTWQRRNTKTMNKRDG